MTSAPSAPSAATGAARWLDTAVVLAFASLIHLVFGSFTHPPLVDEIFHLLAARSWAEDGSFALADGAYTRARFYTAAVGVVFWLFGESAALARGLSAAAGIAWLLALFLWVRHVAGRPAAYIAALLFCMDPTSYFLFHFVRFYSFQGLCFFAGAIALYFLVTRWTSLKASRRIALALACVTAFGLSVHLQVVTLGGVSGLILWLLFEFGETLLGRLKTRRAMYLWGLGVVALAVIGLIVGIQTGVLRYVVWAYTNVALWNAGAQYTFHYYNDHFLETYPALWGLFPVALLLALVRRPRPALFCGCIFASVFLIQSGGAMKAPRYMFSAVPFFFAIWGIAIAEALPIVRRLASEATARILPGTAPRLGAVPGIAGIAIAAAFLIAATPSLRTTIKDMRDWPKFPSHPDSTWAEARDLLDPWLARAAVVLTTNDVDAVYYFGRYDYQVSRYRVTESITKNEFGMDSRTGRWTMSTPDSVGLVLSCYPTGLFIGDPFQWRHAIMGASDPVADMIEARAERLPLPAHLDIRAYFWDRTGEPVSADCSKLPDSAARG